MFHLHLTRSQHNEHNKVPNLHKNILYTYIPKKKCILRLHKEKCSCILYIRYSIGICNLYIAFIAVRDTCMV